MIRYLDENVSIAVNQIRVFRLKNGFADEISQVLIQAISANVVNPLTQAIWVATADGTVIRFSPYANGAESLARMIFRPEQDDDPTP